MRARLEENLSCFGVEDEAAGVQQHCACPGKDRAEAQACPRFLGGLLEV